MYATHTIPGFEPGELLDFQQMADLAGLSIFTVRTQWGDYEMPFEWIGGNRRIRRSAAEKWVAERKAKLTAKAANGSIHAERMYQQMLDRQAAAKK